MIVHKESGIVSARGFACTTAAVAIVTVMVLTNFIGAAETYWEDLMPWDDKQGSLDDMYSVSQISSDGITEVVSTSRVSQYDTFSYPHTVTIGSAVIADTYRNMGYAWGNMMDPYTIDIPTSSVTLGDNEGERVKIPAYGGEQAYVRYFGKCHDEVFISSNGYILLGQPVPVNLWGTTTDPLWVSAEGVSSNSNPSSMPHGIIGPYIRDMKPNLGGSIKYGIVSGYIASYSEQFFGVMWQDVPSADGVVQSFGVYMSIGTVSKECADSIILFVYKKICCEWKYDKRSRTTNPRFAIGLENQLGTRSLNLYDHYNDISPRNQFGFYDRALLLGGYAANRYCIDYVKLAFSKYRVDPSTGYSSNDPSASVAVGGGYGGMWASSNTKWYPSDQPSDPDVTIADAVNRALVPGSFAIAAALVSAVFPPYGVVIAGAGIVYSVYTYLENSKATSTTYSEAHGAATADDDGWALDVACDGVGNRLHESGDVMIAPRFNWEFSGDMTELLKYDHHLCFNAEIGYREIGTNTMKYVLTSGMNYKMDHNRLWKMSENFNKGTLEGWTLAGSGTGSAIMRTDQSANDIIKEDFGDFYLGDWARTTSGGTVSLDTSYKETSGSLSAFPALKLVKTQETGESSAWIPWVHQANHFQVSYMMRASNTASPNYAYMYLREGPVDRVCVAFADKKLQYVDNSGMHAVPGVSIAVNQWFYITVDVWPKTGNYSISMAGQVKLASAPMLYQGTPPDWGTNHWIDRMYFRAAGVNAGSLCSVWVDDIRATSDTSVFLSYSGSANKARLSSPVVSIDRSLPYSISLNFMSFSTGVSTYIVVMDDGKAEVVFKRDTSTGLDYLWAFSGTTLTKVKPLSAYEWGRIVVKVNPTSGQYEVAVNNYDTLTFNCKAYDGDLGKLTLSFGSKVSPASTEIGSGLWDDIVVAEYK